MLRPIVASLATALLVLAPGTVQESGRDPLRLYPENYALLLENDHVRVLEFTLKKGARESFHEHPKHVAVVLQGFKIRFTFPDGRTAIRETKTGEVLFSDAVTHASENIGDTDAHGILIELEEAKTEGRPVESAFTGADELLTAFTFIHGFEGRAESLQEHLLSLTAPTRAEPGNVAYDLYRSRSEPHEFLRFEQWTDAAALEAHKATPHLQASFAKRQQEGWSTEITLWERVDG